MKQCLLKDEIVEKLSIKNKLIYLTVTVSFVCGWVITFLGFYAPPIGQVDNTIIVIFGQALTYCAYGLGLREYGEYIVKKALREERHDKERFD